MMNARGRNGWFKVKKLSAFSLSGRAAIEITSARKGCSAPVILDGTPEELLDLAQFIQCTIQPGTKQASEKEM
jgi:hypothetical protein